MRTKMWIYANEIVDSCERDYYYSSEQALALSCHWNLCANKDQYEFHGNTAKCDNIKINLFVDVSAASAKKLEINANDIPLCEQQFFFRTALSTFKSRLSVGTVYAEG